MMFFLHSNLLSLPNKNDGCTGTWELRLLIIRENDYVLHWKAVIKTNLMGSSEHMVALYGRNKNGRTKNRETWMGVHVSYA